MANKDEKFLKQLDNEFVKDYDMENDRLIYSKDFYIALYKKLQKDYLMSKPMKLQALILKYQVLIELMLLVKERVLMFLKMDIPLKLAIMMVVQIVL